MDDQNDILKTGILYWIKNGRRGVVPVSLDLLTDDQKVILRSGLESQSYPLYLAGETLNTHLIWEEEHGLYEVLVTNIELSIETKRILSPGKPTSVKKPIQPSLSEMKQLQNNFLSGKVDETFVQNALFYIDWKPWQQGEWKSDRELKIQKTCEKCGNTEGLVLQHTIQPRRIPTIVFDLVGERYEEFQQFSNQNINKVELHLPEYAKIVPVCPKCGSSRVRHRERKGNYICEKTRRSVICKHEFSTPDFGYDERDIEKAEKERISKLRDMFCREQGIFHEATVIALKEVISYLRMEHVKTLCKRCAFLEDKPYQKP